jgi:hypothetical protein
MSFLDFPPDLCRFEIISNILRKCTVEAKKINDFEFMILEQFNQISKMRSTLKKVKVAQLTVIFEKLHHFKNRKLSLKLLFESQLDVSNVVCHKI